jgi:hypothetical protein
MRIVICERKSRAKSLTSTSIRLQDAKGFAAAFFVEQTV